MDNKRFVREVHSMRERLGHGPKLVRGARGQLSWHVDVYQEGQHLPIAIVYPEDFPWSPPRILSRVSLPADTPHLMGNELCWHSHGARDRSENTWDPAHDTATMCVGVARRWLLAFLVYLTLGTWPEPES